MNNTKCQVVSLNQVLGKGIDTEYLKQVRLGLSERSIAKIIENNQLDKEKQELLELIPQSKIWNVLEEIDEWYNDDLADLWDAVSFVADFYRIDDLRINTMKRQALGLIPPHVYEDLIYEVNSFYNSHRIKYLLFYKQCIKDAKKKYGY